MFFRQKFQNEKIIAAISQEQKILPQFLGMFVLFFHQF